MLRTLYLVALRKKDGFSRACLDLTRRVVVERTQGSRLDREPSVTVTVKMARLIGRICGEEGQGSQDEADALGPFDPL